MQCDDIINKMLQEIKQELLAANEKFPDLNSPHEGYAVILEELDEMWDNIQECQQRGYSIYAEARQVAAMALKMMDFMWAINNQKGE